MDYNDNRVQSLKYWCVKVLYLPVHNKKINIEHIDKKSKQQINDYIWRWFISSENNANMIIQYVYNNSVKINDEEFWKKQILDFCPRTMGREGEIISNNPSQFYSTMDKQVFNFNFFEKIVKLLLIDKKWKYDSPFFPTWWQALALTIKEHREYDDPDGKYVDKIYRYGRWQILE